VKQVMVMAVMDVDKVIIVEGKSDKRKVETVINEPVEIICTNGTLSLSKLDELVENLYFKEVYVLVDADEAGEKLRKQFKREFPEASHLYIDKMYREVAAAPDQHIASVLLSANIDVQTKFL
jgi:toprim domain protein